MSVTNIHSKAMDKPTHPVDLIVCGFATQEGWFELGTIPRICHNPGDLRYAGQMNAVVPVSMYPTPPIATFTSDNAGITALYRQVWLWVAAGWTVTKMVQVYAPPNENNTSKYLEDMLKWTGLPGDVPVMSLIPGLVRLY